MSSSRTRKNQAQTDSFHSQFSRSRENSVAAKRDKTAGRTIHVWYQLLVRVKHLAHVACRRSSPVATLGLLRELATTPGLGGQRYVFECLSKPGETIEGGYTYSPSPSLPQGPGLGRVNVGSYRGNNDIVTVEACLSQNSSRADSVTLCQYRDGHVE